jgi:hypothetical protein
MEGEVEMKTLAFKKVSSKEAKKGNLEYVMERSLSLENDSLHNEELGEIVTREFVRDAREDSAVKLLTVSILQTYKQVNQEFEFVIDMKPRRELTVPSEGIKIIF